MDMEITIVKTFRDFSHNFFKKQPFLIRILAISCEKNLATLHETAERAHLGR